MSLATTTRDAVVAEINAATLTPNLTAIAVYEITQGLKDLAGGQIIVMPSQDDMELINRAGLAKREVSIDVGVQYKATKTQPADQLIELDPYLTLAETIAATLFLGRKLPSGQACLKARYPHGVFMPEHLKDFKVLTSVVTLTFTSNQ